MEKAKEIQPHITYAENAYEAARDADAVLIVTEWNEFKFLTLERLREMMRGNILFDGRNIYDPARMRRLGFDYHCIGRPAVASPTR
jgi:UDPglucose 6-dehydrogenase